MSYTFIYFLLIHWLADFVFQTDWMAKNKATSQHALAAHVLAYFTVLTISTLILAIFAQKDLPSSVIPFICINVVSHLLIDYVTSRISSTLHKNGDIHNFFVVIGFDQFLHISILYWSYFYFLSNF